MYVTFESAHSDDRTLDVEDEFDEDEDLEFYFETGSEGGHVYLRRPEVIALRDHLTSVLAETEEPEPEGFSDGEEGDIVVALRDRCCVKADDLLVIEAKNGDGYTVALPGGSVPCWVPFDGCEFVRPAEGEFSEDDDADDGFVSVTISGYNAEKIVTVLRGLG